MIKTNKFFFGIIFTIIIVLIILIALKFYFEQKSPSQTNTGNSQQTNPPEINTEDNKLIIPTSQGDVKINNIYRNPVSSFDGVSFKETSDYQLLYFPETKTFNITILNPDIQKARDEAEKNFLETLGISEEDACKLNVNLQVFFQASEKAAGQNFGLSFCPNGKPLPAK